MNNLPPIIQIGDVLVSSDIFTEYFCCDLTDCHGICCVEGDAGAPVTLDEVMEIEGMLDEVWQDLSASAQAVIDKQGVAYTDQEGDLVTSIVNGKECVFASLTPFPSPKGEGSTNPCWLCMLEKAARNKASANSHLSPLTSHLFVKPISCALYPIRVKQFSNGLVGLNYNRWKICEGARKKGRELKIPVYRFLRDPLIRRFGEEWYKELCDIAENAL
ncbi:MAG: DUF3109 family protein [Prevotella sp.]|nr:DUF3109 family protein [Prevotella sp.]